jgi:mono/diheme cytochrome c family protein
MMHAQPLRLCCLLAAAVLAFGALAGGREEKAKADAERLVAFDKEIRPIFEARCLACHGPDKQRSGFRLDRKAAALKGGDTGPAILPGKSGDSPLIRRLTSEIEKERMPPTGDRLTPEQIARLRKWIDQGARWPATTADTLSLKDHWAFKPVTKPALPVVESKKWIRNGVDHFILARLEKEKLAPSPEADRATLIRRLKFDLLGLPPSPEEVEAFVSDKDDRAYEKLVDRFLESPHYGERWARHWLDVVRFAESDGFETNQPRPNAWPYRDYVIRSFTEDKPYDRFIAEQLAGDAFGVDEATGFLVGGTADRVGSPDPVLTAQQRADELNDMLATTSSTFLGLTVGCARCHNHKFDPISHVDYHAFKAIFAGVRHPSGALPVLTAFTPRAEAEKVRRDLAAVEAEMAVYEPLAYPMATLLMDHDSPGVHEVANHWGSPKYAPGTGRGQRDDPGDAKRLPTLGRGPVLWSKTKERDLITFSPRVKGRFRVWISWGVLKTGLDDVRCLLDADGDLKTRDDQVEIARVDQQKFADGTAPTNQDALLWSGFHDAGVHNFTEESSLVLRRGESNGMTSSGVVVLQAVPDKEKGKATDPQPRLRASVNRKKNVERFAPVEAKYVRMTIYETIDNEPCIDELEVFTAGAKPHNVALASGGAKATASGTLPGYDIHKLEHVNDGRYGNGRSWISNERGKGWIQLELPETVKIDRIVWSRDRTEPGQYSDRVATRYVFEVAVKPGEWRTVASSDDRIPYRYQVAAVSTVSGLSAEQYQAFSDLALRRVVLQGRVRQLATQTPSYSGVFTTPGETHLLHRGDPMQKKDVVPPGALTEIGPKLSLSRNATDQERRLALARWITDKNHPLTARVLVNRLWHYHFGQGLVRTPSDFGHNGDRPSHPELLDFLASEFLANAWRIKPMHRLIVLSATYRQASAANTKGLAADAQARLLWRYPRRRLEAEPLRDAILFVSGKLDLRLGGPGFDLFEPNGNYVKVYNSKKDFGPAEWRRMVYQSKPRMQLDDTFGPFDCPDAGQIAPKRTSSTTPLQALNLLNSRFVFQQAAFFAERVRKEAGSEEEAQVKRAFRLAFQRVPTEEEQAAAVRLVRDHGLTALFNASEFLYVF